MSTVVANGRFIHIDETVIAGKLPSAEEYTWFQKFSIFSMIIAFMSLIECVVSHIVL